MVTPESQITFQFLSDPYVVLIRFTLYWHITALMYSVFDEFMHLIIILPLSSDGLCRGVHVDTHTSDRISKTRHQETAHLTFKGVNLSDNADSRHQMFRL